MAFTRIKTVKGRPYAYLVQNTWVDGKVRQKVLEYLGPVENKSTNTVVGEGSSYGVLLQSVLENHVSQCQQPFKVSVSDKLLTGSFSANNGVLNQKTFLALCNYEHVEERKPGTILAVLFSQAGVAIDPQSFVQLYQAKKVINKDA